MKKIVAVILCIILAILLSFSTLALDNDYSIKVPKDFISANDDDKLSQLSKIFSVSIDALEEYFDDNDIIFMAADKDNTCQVTLSKTDNAFSENTVSFSLLSDDELKSLSSQIAGETFEEKGIVIGKDKTKYIKLQKSGNDSGGGFNVTEFITICDGELYTLSVYVGENSEYENLPETVFKSLKIEDTLIKNGGNNLLFTILAIAGISFLAALVVYLLYTVIKDIKSSKK